MENLENLEDTNGLGSADYAEGEAFLFKEQIHVFPNKPYPEKDRGPLKAYHATGKKGERFFAVLCRKELIPRIDTASKYFGLDAPLMPPLKGSGAMKWSEGVEVYAFIFDDCFGRPLVSKTMNPAYAMREDFVRKVVLTSLINTFSDMHNSDLLHGSVNAHNLYVAKGTGEDTYNSTQVFLGECLSLPFSYDQSPMYLTIDKMMAEPIGRGPGTISDDLYALGVTLTVLLRKKDPLEGKSDVEILQEKLEKGSFSALMGKNRIVGALLDLLRGLLADDPAQRWTLEEVLQWQQGQRIGVKQGELKRYKAKRPITVAGLPYYRPETLLTAMPKNKQEVKKLIADGDLGQWLERSVANTMLLSNYNEAHELSEDFKADPNFVNQLIARIGTVIAPDMPLFYGDTIMTPEGFGKSFVCAFLEGRDIAPFIDIINSQLLIYWMDNTTSITTDLGAVYTALSNCRNALKQGGIGYGFERCLYILSSEAPCLSPAYKDYYIRSAEDLFLAFDDLCLKGDAPDVPIDRHVAAFLSVHDRKNIDSYLVQLNSKEEFDRAIAVVKIFASIQYRSKMPAARGISKWLIDRFMQPILEKIHDKQTRTYIEKQLNKLQGSGSITKIATFFDEEKLLRKDYNNFMVEMRRYKMLSAEYEKLHYILENNIPKGRAAGREIAALVSAFIGGGIIIYILFTKLNLF